MHSIHNGADELDNYTMRFILAIFDEKLDNILSKLMGWYGNPQRFAGTYMNIMTHAVAVE